ncbi:PREDICTED: XK-related protein 8 [Nanorana parkeri]|uniref:XK-related protein 8 n=1 Tax=Nanorana parkeri TaxID=125878 RepID=UPI00085497A5|nr:PREDICTED: XK-related protein 8 [Nanorana parkeri]
MPSCLPPHYRLLDLVFALWGTVAFLGDLGSDVWSAVKYYKGGDTVLAVVHFGLYLLSSCVLQLLSCGWYWADWREWGAEAGAAEQKHTQQNGIKCADLCSNASSMGPERCDVDAAVYADTKLLSEDSASCHRGTNGDTAALQESPIAVTQDVTSSPAHQEKAIVIYNNGQDAEYTPFLSDFYTSKIWQTRSCLTILHILHFGYPFRCLHSLEVGIAAYRSSESSSKFNLYQEYAYFLTHDLSMMRLIETFLENTPQLILVLYVIIQRETIYLFQYFSIGISFICISWAILDYHQSLRLFLKDKEKLNFSSSIIYFVWNFFLISSRIMCITLFTLTFHWMTVLHFVGVWLGFFLWVCLQKTDFMKSRCLEPFYRATVAAILYFSWFNIADGRTVYRCIIYHVFITIDSALLLLSWMYLRVPSILDQYESAVIGITVLFTVLGLLLRVVYYKWVHPNVTKEKYYDQPDGIRDATYRIFTPTEKIKSWKQNERMVHLARQNC